jgi:hypothetical protein
VRAFLLMVFVVFLSACGVDQVPGNYVLKSSGIFCVTHPCPSLEAVPLGFGKRTLPVTDVDLTDVTKSQDERNQLEARIFSEKGLKVEGWVEIVPDAGPAGDAKVFHVIQVLED